MTSLIRSPGVNSTTSIERQHLCLQIANTPISKYNINIMAHLPEGFTTTLSYVGAATTCYWTIQLARHLYSYFRPTALPRYNPTGKDSWALVTGASDGIGFGFAQELSQRGFNVFLHGRNREKLIRRQEELQAEFPNVITKIIVSDASNISENIDTIAHEVGNVRLTVLVNNVGGESRAYRRLTELTYEDVRNTINLNVTFMTQVTRSLLPVLEKNGPGLIMNVSSTASFGMPYLPVYSGTKGFVDSFSRSLDAEVKADGRDLEVLAVRVGSVKSQGNDVELSLSTPGSRTMAAAALNRVGSGFPLVFGYWGHALPGLTLDWIPRNVVVAMLAKTMRGLKRDMEAKQGKQE